MTAAFPYLIAFLSVAGYATLTALGRKSMVANMPPFAFISLTMIVLAGTSITASLLFEKKFSVTDLRWTEWGWLILFGIINFVAFALYLTAVKTMPAAHYQIIYAISPVVTAVLAFFLLGEAMPPKFYIGLSLVAAGLYIALIK